MALWTALLALVTTALATPLPELGALPDAEYAAAVEQRCLDRHGRADCDRAVLRRLSYALARASVSIDQSQPPAVLARIACPAPAADHRPQDAMAECLEAELGPGHLLRDWDRALYAAPTAEDRIRLVVLEAPRPVPPWPAAVRPFDAGGIYAVSWDQEVVDAALVTLLGLDPTISFDGDWSVTGLPVARAAASDVLRTAVFPLPPPVVVCADRVVRPAALTVAGVGLGIGGFFSEYVLPVYEYELPCVPELLVGPEVEGIALGAREPGTWGSPPVVAPVPDPAAPERVSFGLGPLTLQAEADAARSTPGGRRCTILLGGTAHSYRSCELRFAGDLNRDGRPDYAWDGYGEMGCGAFEVWLSQPDGAYRQVERVLREC